MSWRILQIGEEETIIFAVDELVKYLRQMDNEVLVDVMQQEVGYKSAYPVLQVGIDPSYLSKMPVVEDYKLDDAIYIDVKDGVGVITGTNSRSILIAVYRYLKELGCLFIRPGIEGEEIPQLEDKEHTVFINEKASYRHRGVCIEGAAAYQNISDMIEWLPKVGLNGYFTQFLSPFGFMNKWYLHTDNTTITPEPITKADAFGMMHRYESEVKRRGLMYHAVGHGWTCEPFGVDLSLWKRGVDQPSEEYRKYISVLNGERQLFGWTKESTTPGDTNLCYSQEYVREHMTDAVVEYCETHLGTDYMHFWLADGLNNHCECNECNKMLPADWYVMLLNLIDKKLTAKGIKTKIVFLIYVDLLWAPEKCRIENPDRFVLMFAPITRVFSKSFALDKSIDLDNVKLSPYVRNKLPMPTLVEENVALLKKWKRAFQGDSFDYDYHAVGAHLCDPGFMEISRIMAEDMQELKNIGINGMVSCQEQRVFFPTSLLMHTMAETLWNRDVPFEELSHRYYKNVFGEDGPKVENYLKQMSKLFDLGFMRGEYGDSEDTKHLEMLSGIEPLIREFVPVIEKNIEDVGQNKTRARSWRYLQYHAKISQGEAEVVMLRLKGDLDGAKQKAEELCEYVCSIELKTQSAMDASCVMIKIRKMATKKKKK